MCRRQRTNSLGRRAGFEPGDPTTDPIPKSRTRLGEYSKQSWNQDFPWRQHNHKRTPYSKLVFYAQSTGATKNTMPTS